MRPAPIPNISILYQRIRTFGTHLSRSSVLDSFHPCLFTYTHSQRMFKRDKGNLTGLTAIQKAVSIECAMASLLHVSGCNEVGCTFHNCQKLKLLFQHAIHCTVKYSGGCQHCCRLWRILEFHSKDCTEDHCPVPHCLKFRCLRHKKAGNGGSNPLKVEFLASSRSHFVSAFKTQQNDTTKRKRKAEKDAATIDTPRAVEAQQQITESNAL